MEPLGVSVDEDLNNAAKQVEVYILSFIFIFEVDKSGALAPTYPSSKRKSELRSSF